VEVDFGGNNFVEDVASASLIKNIFVEGGAAGAGAADFAGDEVPERLPNEFVAVDVVFGANMFVEDAAEGAGERGLIGDEAPGRLLNGLNRGVSLLDVSGKAIFF
jgi:hypothetical protein